MKIEIGPYPEAGEVGDWSERVTNIHIDEYDVWSFDHTLAMIILPGLKMLKKIKHGAPAVEAEDVPEELRMPPEQLEKYNTDGETDDNFFIRWDYVLDEMIWAFEQIVDDDSDAQFHTGVRDTWWQPLDKDRNKIGEPYPFGEGEDEDVEDAEFYEMITGPNDTSHFDKEGHIKHHERIANGTRLFGVYYRALWD